MESTKDGIEAKEENVVKDDIEEEQKEESAEEDLDSDDDKAMDVDPMSVGAGGSGKGKMKKGSSSSSKKSSKAAASKPVLHKNFKEDDDEWAKDLPAGFKENHSDWLNFLTLGIYQGAFEVCWALAIAKCIQALYAKDGVKVELSAQHLINNIGGKSPTGHIIKYEEIAKLLIHEGIVTEEVCPFTGSITENCSKDCARSTSEESFSKIKEFNLVEENDVKEKDVIRLVAEGGPLVAIVTAYDSFREYKTGIYQGPKPRKDGTNGLHAVIVYGFGTTPEGEHYWLVQNPWGPKWGQNGLGKILRQCSKKDKEPSLFLNIIHMKV